MASKAALNIDGSYIAGIGSTHEVRTDPPVASPGHVWVPTEPGARATWKWKAVEPVRPPAPEPKIGFRR